jgi:hypothetical protein
MKSLILVALLSSGCLSIEAEIEESCVSHAGVEIEAASGTSISRTFIVDDLSDVHRLMEYNAELEFSRADVRPTSGITNLGFVEHAAVAIDNTPIYSCTGNCVSESGIVLPPTVDASATAYLAADSLAVSLTVMGQLPQVAWTADIDVCVRGHLSN